MKEKKYQTKTAQEVYFTFRDSFVKRDIEKAVIRNRQIDIVPIDGLMFVKEQNLRGFIPTTRAEGFKNDNIPSVTISTQQVDNQISIKVKDNGLGMPEVTRAKVFQPFFTTKPTGQGTGLGLSLAYDIETKGHGGSLEVKSTEGVGSEFIITLPLKNNE
jgi:K+-sensing histidine kinase KdpD